MAGQVQRDLPAGQLLHRGGYPTHGDSAHSELAQQWCDLELVALTHAIHLDHQQPVSRGGTRQQFGPWLCPAGEAQHYKQ